MPSAPSERGPIMHGKMLFLTRRIEWVGSRQRAYNNVDKMGGAGLQGATGGAGPQGATGGAGPQGATGGAGPQGATAHRRSHISREL